LLRWLAHRFPHLPLHHVSALAVSGRSIYCRRVNGIAEELLWDDLQRVLIRTTDQGPFSDDVFFILETTQFTVWIPQPARGCDELLQALQRLPGFDNAAVIAAMGCTDNHVFHCWQRSPQT